MDATTEQSYTKLVNNLEDLTKSYRTLLDLLRKEKEHLLAANREALEESNQIKEAILFKIRAHDSLRSRYATELTQHLHGDVEQPRLLQIAQLMGGPQGDKLRTVHSALDILIKRISELNKENEEYTKSALRNLGGALGEIKDTLSGGKKTYERGGQYKLGPDKSGHFVKREV